VIGEGLERDALDRFLLANVNRFDPSLLNVALFSF